MVARAFAERNVYEAAMRAAGTSEELRPVLTRLASLFAASRVEADLGWFLEHRVIAQAGATRIRALVTLLSRDVAADSLGLVDAFSIPDRVLGAPIGLSTPTD